jgi:hypothetical protein
MESGQAFAAAVPCAVAAGVFYYSNHHYTALFFAACCLSFIAWGFEAAQAADITHAGLN